ncbi:putative bifunctional diguanylate cyclase/phosphodiesterase [Pseudomonas matsuisoli]|uniref:cyclic-guanylate-specific phosphodiesterase n=1 Tax=Pseudomonas matsuisoli TaxID=1515666 RepID=A0A917Q3E5_9PSED|nr:EAL domain-containing protein [Pseudomonas matsuisoli]GGK09621.1 bifunctional diguanylate cyclase/phosphodiesterase [Pseudomonas matsuisoli]
MKTHLDTAQRAAAEVLQLPVPSRLGMLRFERINEPAWALLFIDPASERLLGVPAADLCSLLDAPFASLMAPQTRYRLHDEIQQQLAEHNRYTVQYLCHTPCGTRRLIETGEVTQQHGRALLHGYMVVSPEPDVSRDSVDLHSCTSPPPSQRTETHQKLILTLARQRYESEDPSLEAAELIARSAADIYETSRSSIWRLVGDTLVPVYCYNREQNAAEQLDPIDLKHFPAYLQTLNSDRAIAASAAHLDARTAELVKLWAPEGTPSALLDAGIRIDGQIVGVLCLEESNRTRDWQPDEIAFAGELADQYAQVMANQERRSATNALFLFQRAVEQSVSAFLLVDRDGYIEYVNPSFMHITQYAAEDVKGRRLSELPALENLSELISDAQSVLVDHNGWQGEFRSRRKNLEPYWGQLSLSKVFGESGELTHYIGIYEDITEAKLAQQRIEKLAYTDNLTGIGNRPFFIRSLEERFEQGDSQPRSLLLVDIDNFKRINDSLGHQTGDKLLFSLARRLRDVLNTGDILARFASNEFALLIDNADLESGRLLAQKVLYTLDKPLFVDGQLINITGSVGVACTPDHGTDPQTVLKHAGLALHKAKANGKHQLQVFTEALNAEASYKLFLENNLRRALDQNELEVFYQPKLCLRSGRLLGLEALLRWNHPERGMIRPDQFISVAEETGLIVPIGKWVIREACRMSRQMQAAGLGRIQVAINLSPKQFSDADLVDSISSILDEEQHEAELLELELTESLLLDATDDTRQQLNRLKSLGLTLAMDDFGTGYSSLSYLKKFPIDVIKIDRTFVKDIPDNQDDMEITSAVIAMAHNLKLRVVAEGIETSEQLAFLRRQHCDIGQGYLFDKPISPLELLTSLRRYPRRG